MAIHMDSETHMDRLRSTWRHLKQDKFLDFLYLVARNFLEGAAIRMEKRYDRVHNVQTVGIVNIDNLHDVNSDNIVFAENYVPTPVSVLKRSITAIDEDIEDFVFIDIGSGKGRMLFAASRYPFKKIIGVAPRQYRNLKRG